MPLRTIRWSVRGPPGSLSSGCNSGVACLSEHHPMKLTDYHAKYFAYELTKRSPSDSVEMLAGVLADAQVDLNPHQIEAALFAFRNPFSRGAMVDVGLACSGLHLHGKMRATADRRA